MKLILFKYHCLERLIDPNFVFRPLASFIEICRVNEIVERLKKVCKRFLIIDIFYLV